MAKKRIETTTKEAHSRSKEVTKTVEKSTGGTIVKYGLIAGAAALGLALLGATSKKES